MALYLLQGRPAATPRPPWRSTSAPQATNERLVAVEPMIAISPTSASDRSWSLSRRRWP